MLASSTPPPTRATRWGSGLLAVGLFACLAGSVSTAPASAASKDSQAPRTSFTLAADGSSGTTATGAAIPNVDSVKSTIRTYYGAKAGIADKTASPYISEITTLLGGRAAALPQATAGQAIVLDTDDTTLWTYDLEDAELGFDFDAAVQDAYVQQQRFPAVPGMVAFVQAAIAKGYTIVGLTGRNDDQKAASIANLAKFYPANAFTVERYFTKYTGKGASQKPAYLTCTNAPTCTTVEYKAGTRKYVETPDNPGTPAVEGLGLDVVLNIGDQWSDLQGGFSDAVLKLPNPTYYLPSANLPGLSEPALAPRTTFTMAPDGSSGSTQGGEGIPNIDSVKATVRAYYGAVGGVASRTSSAYLTEMSGLTKRWAKRVAASCQTQSRRRGVDPAVVFDADDTTLWTYDFEDAGVHFDFDPSVQDDYVQAQRFPAVPGMTKVVKAARAHGCAVVGITGRNADQERATVKNLRKFYGKAFTRDLYFTKWTGEKGSRKPGYITCKTKGACTTVEYKAGTRRHLERDLGYRIVGSFGDQVSDLTGGYADRRFKLPNPTYYLP